MSSFQVTSATVNAIASFLCYSRDSRNYTGLLKREGGIAYAEDAEALSKDMVLLNTAALDARYGQGNPAPRHVFAANMVSKLQAFKSLGCWLYQCAEGNIPEQPIYKAFKTIHDMMACEIVRALPEYDPLPRDLPETTSRAIPLTSLAKKADAKPAIDLSASPCSIASRNVKAKRKMSAHLESLIAKAPKARVANKGDEFGALETPAGATVDENGVPFAW